MQTGPAPAEPSAFKLRCCSLACAIAALCIHGYHPLAEDGGLYIAGVELRLDPTLFPHDRAFVVPHLAYSVFAPFLAACVRLTHAPMLTVVFALFVLTRILLMHALAELADAILLSRRASMFALCLLTACLTIPIAGTSLLLDDPYLTARSFSLPLSLFAIANVLRFSTPGYRYRRLLSSAGFLMLAAAFHPLMAMYAGWMAIAIAIAERPSAAQRRRLALVSPMVLLLAASIAQWLGSSESVAANAAVHSRYYWFLSEWQWYERLGLAAPVLILACFATWNRRRQHLRTPSIIAAIISVATFAAAVALLFAHENFRSHIVARLQPLRCLQCVYILFFIVLFGKIYELASRSRLAVRLCWSLPLVAAAGMFFVQRTQFTGSHHIEFPWLSPANPWAQAFEWARTETPPNALFALDARYVNLDGEDAQVFRASAQRSQLPDFSKDGGEAAITPSLAAAWLRGSAAQAGLSALHDSDRDARLLPLHVDYEILQTNAVTAHPCPYTNAAVKICQLPPAP